MAHNYIGCSVVLHSDRWELLGTASIIAHDVKANAIELSTVPENVQIGKMHKVMIFSPNRLREYTARADRYGGKTLFLLSKGQDKENRASERHPVDFDAVIESLTCDNKEYTLCLGINVKLVNISRSGVRFTAPFYTLLMGDIFSIRMEIGGLYKLIVAEVVNNINTEPVESQYGCRFRSIT